MITLAIVGLAALFFLFVVACFFLALVLEAVTPERLDSFD